MNKPDGIDDYNESVWLNLGHSAFEKDNVNVNEDVEWWDIDKDHERE